MKLKFEFKAVASPKDKETTVIAITSIVTEEGERYVIPEGLTYINFHKKLQETKAFKKVKGTLEKRHDEVKIWITLSEDLEKIYLDDEGNIQFGEKYLKQVPQENILEKREEERNLSHIADQFILGKFNYKTSNIRQ